MNSIEESSQQNQSNYLNKEEEGYSYSNSSNYNLQNSGISKLLKRKLIFFIAGSLTFIVISALFLGKSILLKNTKENLTTESITPIITTVPQESSTSTEKSTLSPTQKITPTKSVTPTIKVTNTQTPIQTSIPTPTSRIPNPPIINISYPSENQQITFTSSSQTLCVVDTPTTGDTLGLQRKHNLNNQGWTSYVDPYTLCFKPNEGTNIFSFHYKNRNGDESSIYTRQFSFHLVSDINISLNGQIYRDENCNGTKDSQETGIGTSATINIFKIPEFYIESTINSDSNGSYSFAKTIKENDTLSLKPQVVSPSGYKSYPNWTDPTITFSSSNRTATINIPQVPNEFFTSACQL